MFRYWVSMFFGKVGTPSLLQEMDLINLDQFFSKILLANNEFTLGMQPILAIGPEVFLIFIKHLQKGYTFLSFTVL